MKYSNPPTSATIGPAPIWKPGVGRGTPAGGAAAPGVPHAADGGAAWVEVGGGGVVGVGAVCGGGGGAAVGGGGAGVGAVAGAGADTTSRRASTHASHPFEHRTLAHAPR